MTLIIKAIKDNPMQLTPTEKDKLMLFTAGMVAERRKERVKLNYPKPSLISVCCLWKA